MCFSLNDVCVEFLINEKLSSMLAIDFMNVLGTLFWLETKKQVSSWDSEVKSGRLPNRNLRDCSLCRVGFLMSA